MKLFYSTTSPFARKVNMLLHYTGLIDQTELVLTNFESEELRELNPLGKIPALVAGQTRLFDSPLICEYLDEKFEESGKLSVFHCGRGDYYRVQSAHALANGILDAAVNSVFELKRETEHSPYWLGRWKTALEAAVTHTDLEVLGNSEDVNIATISMIAALGYLDFRLAKHFDWRSLNAELAAWYASIKEEPWVLATAPKDS